MFYGNERIRANVILTRVAVPNEMCFHDSYIRPTDSLESIEHVGNIKNIFSLLFFEN
jgi:hypothetical protein